MAGREGAVPGRQRPDDPRLLREAAAGLLCFGPDRDASADEFKETVG
ncbi:MULTISPECIES: hypothetical protein [unclassified Streptomyces]|nr:MULTISPECIES: hypothetical protein [unclassified Streptomyces]MYS37846.1 hypothetical protein [Streptomyces sp. SID4920]MYX66034.1 hypothetical protein [Streptomyces sp. SID8373]